MPLEQPLSFECQEQRLHGVLHVPAQPRRRGVLIVVGGPQYRVGSHRQFVLLARALAEQSYAVLRFDYRGMGDSGGHAVTFEEIDADLRAASAAFRTAVPALGEIVLWGLCDAASAVLFYAASESHVRGLVLLNPWVRTQAGLARSYLRHYYLRRLFDLSGWRELLREPSRVMSALRSLVTTVRASFGAPAAAVTGESGLEAARNAAVASSVGTPDLAERMALGLERFDGKVLLILSGDDITAAEFVAAAHASRRWRRLLKRRSVEQRRLPESDHTFSRRAWRDQVAEWTLEWLRAW